MNHIPLGKDAAGAAVSLNLKILLASRMLVQANSGAGKSWALRRLLEQTFGHVPHVVIDRDGEFHTLREKHAYVLAGGPGSDCKLDIKIAPLLARRILEHGFSVILDISEFKHHQRILFVRRFLEELIEAPRALWRPLLVVVDEAHIFCPEKGHAESQDAVIDLMSLGRKRGFCGVLATQRISKLNKDAAAEANNKLIGRAALDVDMKRAADEIGFSGREEQRQLRVLDPGEFFAWGPAISREVRKFTMGPVSTTHPEPGERLKAGPPPAPEKLKGILAKLADLPKDAAEQEGELERLRREVGDLRRSKAAASALGITKPDPQALRLEHSAGRVEGYQQALRELAPLTAKITLTKARAVTLFDDIEAEFLKFKHRQEEALTAGMEVRSPMPAKVSRDGVVTFDRPPPKRSRITATYGPKRSDGVDIDLKVARPQQAILDALVWLETVGIEQADRVQLALLAGQSPRSGGYRNNLGALRTAGLIEYPSDGQVILDRRGRAAARPPATPPTTEELHRTLQAKLPAPQWRILTALIEVYPRHLGREDLAAQSDQSATSGGFRNNLGALRSLGFIDYPRPNTVGALPVLFLEK